MSNRLAAPGRQVIPCDISVEMLRQASARLPGRVFLGDVTALPSRDDCLDAVTLVWVLHHVGALDDALAETYRVLRTGGRALAISGTAALRSLPSPDTPRRRVIRHPLVVFAK